MPAATGQYQFSVDPFPFANYGWEIAIVNEIYASRSECLVQPWAAARNHLPLNCDLVRPELLFEKPVRYGLVKKLDRLAAGIDYAWNTDTNDFQLSLRASRIDSWKNEHCDYEQPGLNPTHQYLPGQARAPQSSRLFEKGFSQPAPSLLSLPKGEKIKEGSHLLCRVLRSSIIPNQRIFLSQHPVRQQRCLARRLAVRRS